MLTYRHVHPRIPIKIRQGDTPAIPVGGNAGHPQDSELSVAITQHDEPAPRVVPGFVAMRREEVLRP